MGVLGTVFATCRFRFSRGLVLDIVTRSRIPRRGNRLTSLDGAVHALQQFTEGNSKTLGNLEDSQD